MKNNQVSAEVNIHLRARAYDRLIIDQAAELLGSNRSQFMLTAALKEARQIIANQNLLEVDNQAFCQILAWLDTPATAEQSVGMQRLQTTNLPWSNE
jgi:uncharacterized protein (DUF1778 family)